MHRRALVDRIKGMGGCWQAANPWGNPEVSEVIGARTGSHRSSSSWPPAETRGDTPSLLWSKAELPYPPHAACPPQNAPWQPLGHLSPDDLKPGAPHCLK